MMKNDKPVMTLTLLLLLQAKTLFALNTVPASADEGGQKSAFLTVGFDAYHLNNGDFLYYDKQRFDREKAFPGRNSDDAFYYALGRIEFAYRRRFTLSDVNIVLSKYGYFGNDNFENADEAYNPIRVHEANAALYTGASGGLSIRFGRMPEQIGNARRDYFFHDTIDGLRVVFAKSDFAEIRLTGDVLSNSMNREVVESGAAIRQDPERIDGFEGDTVAWRGGLTARLYNFRSFHYYLRYAASTGGGADISENGKTGLNEADHDYLTLNGLRIFTQKGLFRADLTFAWAYGRDEQFEGQRREYNGYACVANLALVSGGEISPAAPTGMIALSAGYFHPDYCSMKALSPAGLALFSAKSYYLSPYAGPYHFVDGQKRRDAVGSYDASVAKSFLRSDIVYPFKNISLSFAHLLLFANESRKLPIANIPGETACGKGNFQLMGNGLTAALTHRAGEMTITIEGDIFLPSNYYSQRSEYNTSFTDGKDPLFGFHLGCTHFFGF